MAQNPEKILNIYNCPIRNEYSSTEAETEFVIECLNWLIDERKVPKENILIDKVLTRLGAGGKNAIRPDIIVFECKSEEAITDTGEIIREKVVLLAEIKVSNKDKESAIKHQLIPAIDMCSNAVGGIYWDSTMKSYIDRERKESAILTLPKDFLYGKNTKSIIKIDDLMPIEKGVAIWKILNQTIRNYQGLATSQAYEDLFKILISKYYDESRNMEALQFQTLEESSDKVYERILRLHTEANNFYRLGEGFVSNEKINLTAECVAKCVQILEGYSLKGTSRPIIQEFYMKFAPAFLKVDLKQYYTPKEIVAFMTENIVLSSSTTTIDPCAGTGDFMTGVLRSAKNKDIKGSFEEGIHCWDLDENACKLAQINMILNGDGRTNVKVKDSLEDIDADNSFYDFVITNPPFGKDTTYEGESKERYDLAKVGEYEIGKLFIERGLKLLKNSGLLISIIPVGYIDNPSDDAFRKVILSQSRLVGCINLPSGTFKEAGTLVKTSIIILKKCKPPENYKIFTAVANNVGFDLSKKGAPPLNEQRQEDGAFLRDDNNKLISKNDLILIAEKLKAFAEAEGIEGFDPPNKKEPFSYTTLREIENNGYIVNPKVHDILTKYLPTVNQIKKAKHFRLCDDSIKVSNNDHLDIIKEQLYHYVETGSVYRDLLKKAEPLRGWELPGRAKQEIAEDDILVAKMQGSYSNFLYCISRYKGYLASNGFYKVKIPDEKLRLSFFHFLFMTEYAVQATAIATGTIMADIKYKDLRENLYIPILDDSKLEKVREYLKYKREFADMLLSSH